MRYLNQPRLPRFTESPEGFRKLLIVMSSKVSAAAAALALISPIQLTGYSLKAVTRHQEEPEDNDITTALHPT